MPFKHVVVWYLTHSPVCDTITVGGARFISLWVVAVERATMAPRYSSTTQPPPLVNNRASLLTAWGKSVPTLKIQRAYTQLVLPDLVIYHQICKFVCPIFGYFEPNNWWYCDLGKYDLLGFNGGFSDMFSSYKQFFINGIRRFHLQYNKLNSLCIFFLLIKFTNFIPFYFSNLKIAIKNSLKCWTLHVLPSKPNDGTKYL